MARFKKILIAWMLLWLPVAGALAATMPIFALSSTATTSADAPLIDDSMTAQPMPCHSDSDSPTPPGACSHCLLCHLAGAVVLPQIAALPAVSPPRDFSATPFSIHASFLADLATPPPRQLAA
jgi:hypothetical protein